MKLSQHLEELGAVGMTLQECLDEGQTVVLPEIAWGSYALMAQMHNLNVEKYSLFEEDHFNLNSFKSACKNVMEKQNRLVIVIKLSFVTILQGIL